MPTNTKVGAGWRRLMSLREKKPTSRWRLDLVKVDAGIAAVTNGKSAGWLPVPLPDGLYLPSSERFMGEASWPDLAAKVGRPPALKREGDRLAPLREALAIWRSHELASKDWKSWHQRASASLGTTIYEHDDPACLPQPLHAAAWYAANPRPAQPGEAPPEDIWLPALEVELDLELVGPALKLVDPDAAGGVLVGRWKRKELVGLWLRSSEDEREALVIGMERLCPTCNKGFSGAACPDCGKKREEVMG